MNEKIAEIDLNKILSERKEEIEKWIKYPYWKNGHGLQEHQYYDNLFRVEAFEDFKKNVENNRLFFRHPNEWLDELDSILLRLKIVLPDSTEVSQGYYNDTFCQCWSREDLIKMWEEYGKEEDKIYIKMVANLDSLMRAFDNTIQFKGYSTSFWAGTVNYSDFDETALPIRLASDEDVRSFFNPELISLLFLEKRSSSSFEKELRFMVFNRKDSQRQSYAFVDLKKSLPEILAGIIIDPRCKDRSHINNIKSFAEKHGIKIIKNVNGAKKGGEK